MVLDSLEANLSAGWTFPVTLITMGLLACEHYCVILNAGINVLGCVEIGCVYVRLLMNPACVFTREVLTFALTLYA